MNRDGIDQRIVGEFVDDALHYRVEQDFAVVHIVQRHRPHPDGDLTTAWTETHRDYHRTLLLPCGSPGLLRVRDMLSDHAERYRRWSIRMDHTRDVARDHRAITEPPTRDAGLPEYRG